VGVRSLSWEMKSVRPGLLKSPEGIKTEAERFVETNHEKNMDGCLIGEPKGMKNIGWVVCNRDKNGHKTRKLRRMPRQDGESLEKKKKYGLASPGAWTA